MRIIGINGIRSFNNPVWPVLRREYLRRYPDARFYLEEDPSLDYWHIRKMRRFVRSIVAKHDIEAPTILVGHSLGGIIAQAVSARMKKSQVHGIATIFSPHRTVWLGYPIVLGAGIKPSAPLVSFAASHDKYVPWGARHPHAAEHVVLPCDHFEQLVDNEPVARKIVEVSARNFVLEARGE